MTEIRSLRLIPDVDFDTDGTATLNLDTPVPLKQIITEPLESKQLLTGLVEAYAERFFLADNGIGLRTVFINSTDQDILVRFDQAVFNGQWITDCSLGEFRFVVPSHGKTIKCLGVCNDDLPAEQNISRVSLYFRIGETRTTESVITFPQHIPENRYVSVESCEIIPGEYHSGELHFLNDRIEADHHFAVQVSGQITHYERESLYDETTFSDERITLKIAAKVTNLSDETRVFNFKDLAVNGTRMIGLFTYDREIKPGAAEEIETYIPAVQLQGITEIHEISWNTSSWTANDYFNQDIPVKLSFPVEPEDLSAVFPAMPDPLAEGANSNETIQLLKLSEDEEGMLTLQVRIFNSGTQRIKLNYVNVLLNGLFLSKPPLLNNYCIPSLEPGQDCIQEWTSENRLVVPRWMADVYTDTDRDGYPVDYILEDHTLERRGLTAVSEICVGDTFHWDEAVVLKPAHPLSLADKPTTPDKDRLQILEKPMEVRANYILVGETNVYLSVDLINKSDSRAELYVSLPSVNGEEHSFSDPSVFSLNNEENYILPPHSRMTTTISFYPYTKTSLLKAGDVIQDISLTFSNRFSWNSDYIMTPVTITLMKAAPLGVRGGVLLTGKDVQVDVDKADLLLQGSIEIGTDSVSPIQLVPALDESLAESYVSGTATVYLLNRDTKVSFITEEGTDGRYEHLSLMEPVCVTELKKDRQEKILADYSGLACVNAQGQILQTYESPDPGDEAAGLQTEEMDTPLVYSTLYGNIYLDPVTYRAFREEHDGESWPEPDCILNCCSVISMAGDHPSVIREEKEILSSDLNAEARISTKARNRMICESYRELMIPELENQVRPEMQQIVRLGDLRYIRADELEGTLVVCYELLCQDGHTEVLIEAYPSMAQP